MKEVVSRLLEAEFTATASDGSTSLIPVNVKAVETLVGGSTVEVFRARSGQIENTGPGRYGVRISSSLYPLATWFVARWHVVHPTTFAEGYFTTDHFLREAPATGSVLSKQRTTSEVGSSDEVRHLIGLEIERRELLLLRRFNGSYVAFLLRNDSGERCLDCWDDVAQAIYRSDCFRCYGTGFKRGFSSPILGFCYHNAPEVEIDVSSPLGERKRSEGDDFWTISRPTLSSGDIFVKADGSRWRITRMTNTKLEGPRGEQAVRQYGRVRRIDPDDIENQIPVPDLTRPPESFIGFMKGDSISDPSTGILIEASGAL